MPRALLRFVPTLALAAASDLLPEYAVKAAFLYNFFKFVEWPNPVEGGAV